MASKNVYYQIEEGETALQELLRIISIVDFTSSPGAKVIQPKATSQVFIKRGLIARQIKIINIFSYALNGALCRRLHSSFEYFKIKPLREYWILIFI